jgi:hypothetical protein
MDPTQTFLGVSSMTLMLVIVFYISMAIVIFGGGVLDSDVTVPAILILTLGTCLLIGNFGWHILLIPSSAIVLGGLVLFMKLR